MPRNTPRQLSPPSSLLYARRQVPASTVVPSTSRLETFSICGSAAVRWRQLVPPSSLP